MTFRSIISIAVATSWLMIAASSCSESQVYHSKGPGIGNGPPAHAKAYGYRRKQVSGVELVFDSGIGVYVAVGLPNHYYNEGYFYRHNDNGWEISLQPDGDWSFVAEESLPPGLRNSNNGKSSQVSWSVSKKHPRGKFK